MAQNRIRELRHAKGLTVAVLAERAGISHGYLTRVENGKRGLSVELAEQLAMALDTDAQTVLGLGKTSGTVSKETPNALTGLSEDAVPFVPGPGDLPAPRLRTNVDEWQVTTDCLDQIGILPGDVVQVDVSIEAVENLKPLQSVMAQVYHPDFPAVLTATTVMRQFVPPNLLVLNSSKRDELPLRLDSERVAVKGVIIGSRRSFRA